MDKGKSKTDLRAAGKKRLEEFRQKKNQKGGGTGKAIIPTTTTTTTTTTALKALTETERGLEDNNGQEANSGLLPEDHSREDRGGSHIDSSEETLVSCTKGSEEETVLLGGSSTVAVDPSLISPIQTVRPEAHLSVEEASEQCDSLSQPGSAEQGSQCESERERKAVYTILWETPTTDSTQTNEDWQENTYEGTEDFTNKGLDQGNYSTFRLEDNFAGQNRDGLNSKEHSNGVGEYADDNNVQLFEETTQKDLQETLESKGFRDNRCVDPSSVETLPRIEHGGQPTNGVGLLKREEVLGDENLKGLVEEQARVLDEKGRDIDGFRNEIEASTLQSEKEVQIQIENADKERQQFIAEIEEVKTQMQEMVNERKQLLQAASDREMLLISELGELRAAKDEENSQFVLQLSKLHQQLEELGDEKSLFVERYNVTREMSDNLHSENLRLVEESAHEQRKREVSFSMELATWKDRVEDLEKERLESQGSIKELSDRLKRLESDLREVEMLNSHVQDEKKRLESDLQEVEMLNSHVQDEKITLMAQVMELNQSLQAVEEEKTQLGIDRDELKDKSIESALVVEELHLHIQTLEMQGTMHVTELAHLNESLKSLGDEKVEWVMALNDSKQKLDCLNLHVGDLEKAISDLESSNRTLTQELQSLGEEETQLVKLLELSNQNVEALKLELQGWENDKSTYLSENEALSEQLQGLKQDKVNLEKLLDDSCREMESLMSQVQGLEEVRRSYVSEEALLNQRLQGLEEEKAQLVTLLKDSGHQVDALNLQVQSLQDEISVLVSKDIAAVQGLQRLEEEKIQAVELLEDSNKKMEILSLQAQSLEGEMDVFVSENKRLQQQLQGVVEERSHIVKCLEDATSLVQATLKSQCSSTMDERQDLLSMLSALQQHNLDMSEERDRLMGDLQIAREHIRMLETQKEELGLRALKSEEDAKSLREEGQELMMQLDSSRQEVTKMAEERLECEKQQLVELNQGMEQWSNERNELVKELEGHNQQVARLAEERLKLLEEIENYQQEVQQLGCRMIESKEERRQVEEQLKSELQLLHQKLQISESEKTDLKTLLGNLRQELQQTIEDQGLKPVRLEELSKHLQSETKEHALTLKKLQEVFDEKEHLISELEASRLLLQETQAERKQAEHELQLLQEKLETDIEEKGCLVNEVEESRLHARDLSVGNAKLSSRLEQLQEVCRKREEENTHLQALVKELEQQTTVQRRQTSVGCMENASSQSLRLGKSVEDEEVRPSNHSVKKVMNLVKEFEVRASEDAPQLHLRLVASPGKELFSQAWPSREATDALQQERDAGIQTEQALRVQLEGLLKSMQDSNDERSDLTASLMELEVDFHALWQQNVEWADQMSLDIEALKETKAELSGFVDELKGEIVSLQKSEEVLALTFAEIERKATDEFNARLQTERQSQSLASKLQDVEMELGKLKDEHANAGEKLEKSVLERCMLEEGFKELQDAYTQLIQDKAALETLSREEKAQHDMNLEHLKLEAEECNQKLNLLEEQKTLLQQEKESIFLDFTIFRSDVEKRMMESDAVVAKLNDDHAVFQTNLQAAVCRTFPDTEGKQQDVVGTSFESCWKLVDLLVDKSMQLVGLQTQLQEAAVEEKAQYAATLQAMEAKNDVLKQTNKELSSKVQILALEVEQAAGEEEQLRQTLTSNMLEIHTLQTEKQDLLAVQDSEVMGLKQQLEEVTLRSVQQDEQLRTLMQQKQTLEADISKARGDYSAAQTEVVQIEKKLSNTKERLTLAISKGKSVVQQRDAVKQALKEKTEDLERLISSHAESIRAKDMALHEAEVKASSMAAMADRASLLDVELAVAQDTILSLEHTLHEARSVTQDVQLKLEKMGEIPQELGLAAKIEWLAATLTAEQSKAEDEANNVVMLLTELGTSKQESETLAEQVAELNSKCVELEELVAKESSEKTALASELAIAQDTILSLENALHKARSVTQDVQLKLETMGDIPLELGLVAKIEWLAATLTAEQSKAEDLLNNAGTLLTELGTSKQESVTLTKQVAELNGKCVKLEELFAEESSEKTALASELAIAQDTILSLENALHKARSVTQDVQLKLETMGDIPPELGLVAKIEWLAATLTAEQSKAEDLLNNAVTLLTELGTSKQESETLTKQVAELNGKCVKLEELVAEESSEKTALASEIDVLQRVISDRDLAMEAEVAAHLKLQLDISVAMKLLDSVFQDQMFDAEGSHPRFSLGLVESAIARIVEKYRSEACKVEELTHQIAVMAQEAETAKKERDLSMDQRVQQMREMLDYTELELSKTVEKVREAAIIMTQQDKENQVLVQQAQKMQSELLKTSDENVALQADIVMTKKRLSDVRDRLLLGLVGMDVDGGDVSQGESPAQPLSEKAGEIQALADLFCLEMQKKDAALQESNERSLGMAATVSSLQLELDSLRRVSEECKQILLGFTDDATSEKAVRWPNEVSLSSITFPAVGMKWLINTLNEEQQKASQAMHEVGRLEKAVDSVTLEIKDQKGRLEELSNELTFYKEENHGLAERLQVLSSEHTTLGEQAAQVSAERDAMKVEMLALENSLQANQEREHLEGYLLARSLEEMLESAKLELSELSKKNTEMTAALVQHDDDIKGLLQECARLGVESSEARREADAFQAEMLKAVDEKDALQAELNQMEQKLSNTREKLGLAVKKGKAVEKQRDALKMSLEEKTQELNSICISHKEELKVQDAKLHESREKFKSVAEHVLELEFQLTSTLEKVTAAEQSLQESQKFQEEVNIALSHISLLPSSLKTGKVIEKIEWLGMMLGKTQSMAVRSERELEVLSLKLREVQEKVQFLEMENSNGKEMILSLAKKVDEAEIRAASDRAHYESELEFQSQALWEAEARTHAAVAQVEEMQGALQQKQNSLKSMEASRGKAISKLTLTLNRLTELRQQSEGLVTEIENLHRELQNRDAEILGLKEKMSNADAETQNWQERFSRVSAEANLEILKLRKELTEVNSQFEGNLEEMTILQNDLTQKTLELEKLQKHLEMMVLSKEDSSEQAEQSMVVTNQISRSAFEDVDTTSTNGTVDYVATIYALQQHIDNLKSEGQLWRVNMERKDAQLQGLREELDELVKERALLQAGIQAKQFQIDRMQADMAVLISPASDSTAIPALEIEELGARSKRIGHVGSSAAPHVRGARKLFPAEVTIDVDGEINPLLSDLDDKGHGFNSLTNSALVQKRMRALADRLDGLCVVGGRLLMRQPTARLGLAVYWIAIHVYMAMIVSRAIV